MSLLSFSFLFFPTCQPMQTRKPSFRSVTQVSSLFLRYFFGKRLLLISSLLYMTHTLPLLHVAISTQESLLCLKATITSKVFFLLPSFALLTAMSDQQASLPFRLIVWPYPIKSLIYNFIWPCLGLVSLALA